MKDSEVLECAAKKIEEEGWVQNNYYARDEGYCVVGAVAACLNPDFTRNYLGIGQAADVLWQNRPQPMTFLTFTRWNDAPERTKEEVIAALLSAAEKARAREAKEANAVRDS